MTTGNIGFATDTKLQVSNVAAISAARKSATGPAYMIPSIPIKIGKITMKGSKKIICLVNARKVPFTGFPMAAKNVDDIG